LLCLAPGRLLRVTKKDALSVLSLTADLLELLGGNEFRALAYRKSERLLERWEGDWDAATENGFKDAPGVGAQLGASLTQYAQTGVFQPLEELRVQVPAGVLDLFRVRGLGPKKIRALWDAGVASIPALVQSAKEGTLSSFKGFGQSTQQKLLEAAEFVLSVGERHRVGAAQHAFETLKTLLSGIAEVHAAGSLRRGLETVGDLDAVAVGDVAAISAALQPLGVTPDPTYGWLLSASIEGLKLQLATATPQSFGATLLVMTGSQPFLARALDASQRLGYGELTSKGLYDGYELIPTPSEPDAFKALELPYRIPEWREPEHDNVPLPDPEELVTVSSVQGMLHVHSSYSDGAHSVLEMALAAKAIGMSYLGICDHSQTAFYAGGLTPARVREQWQEIDAVNGQLEGIRVLKGIESDILEDGSLDYRDELLAGFDFVVASVHSKFDLSESQQTERLIRAVQNPFTTILGHPTGRLLLRRPSYKLDIPALLEAARASGTTVEINASPYRLDLDWRDLLRGPQDLRVAVNTDAHHTAGFEDLKFGIRVARKAAVTKSRFVNALSADEFLALAKAKRSAG
jgi:DNA polymerase (family X)